VVAQPLERLSGEVGGGKVDDMDVWHYVGGILNERVTGHAIARSVPKGMQCTHANWQVKTCLNLPNCFQC
jgi:hypothetical protein